MLALCFPSMELKSKNSTFKSGKTFNFSERNSLLFMNVATSSVWMDPNFSRITFSDKNFPIVLEIIWRKKTVTTQNISDRDYLFWFEAVGNDDEVDWWVRRVVEQCWQHEVKLIHVPWNNLESKYQPIQGISKSPGSDRRPWSSWSEDGGEVNSGVVSVKLRSQL